MADARAACDDALAAAVTWRQSKDQIGDAPAWYMAQLDAFSKAADAQKKNEAFGPFAYDMLQFTKNVKDLDPAIGATYEKVLVDCKTIQEKGKPPA